jgi:hypothetical protein
MPKQNALDELHQEFLVISPLATSNGALSIETTP